MLFMMNKNYKWINIKQHFPSKKKTTGTKIFFLKCSSKFLIQCKSMRFFLDHMGEKMQSIA